MAPHNTSLPDGMISRTDLPLHTLPQVVPVLQHSMGSSLHNLDFTGKRGRVNKVNPVFFREKYCILWGKNPEFLGGVRGESSSFDQDPDISHSASGRRVKDWIHIHFNDLRVLNDQVRYV